MNWFLSLFFPITFVATFVIMGFVIPFSQDQSRIQSFDNKPKIEKIQIKMPPKPPPPEIAETPKASADSQLVPQAAPMQLSQFSGLLGQGSGPGIQEGNGSSTSDLIQQARNQDRPPQVLKRSALEYPANAKSKGQKGFVIFKALIGQSGDSTTVEIVKSEPAGVFDSVVLNSVKSWKFSPGVSQGKVASMWITQKVRFELE